MAPPTDQSRVVVAGSTTNDHGHGTIAGVNRENPWGETGEAEEKIPRTVLVLLLKVHVDDATRPDRRHVLAIEGLDVFKFSGLGLVTAVFGEEDGDRVFGEGLGTIGVARGAIIGGATPGVDVVTPEIDAFVSVAAAEIIGQVLPDVSVIVGGIADAHRSVVALLDVSLHVAHSRLHKGCRLGVVDGVGDLIPGEKSDDVIILGQLVDDARVASVELLVPRGHVPVDGQLGLGQVADDVDTGFL